MGRDPLGRYFTRVIWRWILSWPWKVGQRSLKVIEISAIRKLGCGFLFAFCSNYGCICSRLWDRCPFCRHTDRQKVTIYSLIRQRFAVSSIVHSFMYFVDFIVLGYQLTLGTTWLGYDLTVGTSWLGYELTVGMRELGYELTVYRCRCQVWYCCSWHAVWWRPHTNRNRTVHASDSPTFWCVLIRVVKIVRFF